LRNKIGGEENMAISFKLLAIGITGGLTLFSLAILSRVLFGIIRSRFQQDKLLDAAARREKHAPKVTEIPTRFISAGSKIQQSEDIQSKIPEESNQPLESEESTEPLILESSSRQVDELSNEEREEYDVRDQARDENILSLRLLVDDLFEGDANPVDEALSDEAQVQSSIELRNSWIEQFETPLNEHATFIEQEKVGSGIMVMDPTDVENDDFEERLQREGGKTGTVQISLAWDDFNDLDLHMFCPSGERIYFNDKKSACGGELDVDMNVRPTSNNAVENIVWTQNAPFGIYKVGVHFYKHHSEIDTTTTCKFRARITVHGEVRNYSGSITHGQAMQMVTSFTLSQKNEDSD